MSTNLRWDDYPNQRPRPRHHRKNLYVPLDDWKKGFSIYKIDADSFNHSDDDYKHDHLLPLEPPVLQLESPVGSILYGAMSFSALGTKIFAFTNQSCALIYNTETAMVAIGPHSPAPMVCGFGTYMRVGDMMYALFYHPYDRNYSFFVMSWGPTAPDALWNPTEGWSWKSLPSPPPKFNGCKVASYALHPDGCTIFVITDNMGRMCTFSFDTKHSVWTRLGDWALPFLDQGHFDTELDSWVGLRFDGSICSCQVVSPTTTPPIKQQLDWKMTKERLVNRSSDKFMTATLTYMGRSKYCLVQSLARDGEEEHPLGDHNGCVLHVTMFGLKYNHKGELQTSKHHSARSFLVSRQRNHFCPAVFWV